MLLLWELGSSKMCSQCLEKPWDGNWRSSFVARWRGTARDRDKTWRSLSWRLALGEQKRLSSEETLKDTSRVLFMGKGFTERLSISGSLRARGKTTQVLGTLFVGLWPDKRMISIGGI